MYQQKLTLKSSYFVNYKDGAMEICFNSVEAYEIYFRCNHFYI